jgi:hypothetical protein
MGPGGHQISQSTVTVHGGPQSQIQDLRLKVGSGLLHCRIEVQSCGQPSGLHLGLPEKEITMGKTELKDNERREMMLLFKC